MSNIQTNHYEQHLLPRRVVFFVVLSSKIFLYRFQQIFSIVNNCFDIFIEENLFSPLGSFLYHVFEVPIMKLLMSSC